MLTLTEDASTIVKTIASQTPGAEDGGLRISATAAEDLDFALAVVPEPQPNDAVVENAGAKVFLEPNAAATLADKVLDAEIDGEGAVRFAIGNQP